jgi:aminopeptidase N
VTFYKGTNIIRNFYNYIGPELFFKGLRNLLKQFSGKNVNFSNFKEIFSNLTSERDLKINPTAFIEPFLTKNGVNELKFEMNLENTVKISKASIIQKSTNLNETFYNFNTNITAVYDDLTEKTFFEQSILNQEVSEFKELNGSTKPAVVLLNHDDISYFRQIFSQNEVEFLIKNGYVSKFLL